MMEYVYFLRSKWYVLLYGVSYIVESFMIELEDVGLLVGKGGNLWIFYHLVLLLPVEVKVERSVSLV